MSPFDAVPAALGLGEAIARALTRCPEAQVEAARERARNGERRADARKLREIKAACAKLRKADDLDDEAGATEALLVLVALGVDLDAVKAASEAGKAIAIEGETPKSERKRRAARVRPPVKGKKAPRKE